MSIRGKTILIIGATTVILFILITVISFAILLKGFTEVEKRDTVKNVQRALDAFNTRLDDMATKSVDWAEWDDTYRFIRDLNKEYIKSNLGTDALVALKIHMMIFVNSSKQIVFSKVIDLNTQKELLLPKQLVNDLDSKSQLLHYFAEDEVKKGIILLPEGPLMLSARPIVTSEGKGPIRGTLIFGRYLDDEIKSSLSQVTHLNSSYFLYNSQNLPPDVLKAKQLLSKNNSTQVIPLTNTTIGGYRVLSDIYGKPVLIIKVAIEREIYQQGFSSIVTFLALSSIIAAVIILASVLLLEYLVISRVALLSSEVEKIKQTHDYSLRISLKGNDELGKLGGEMNRMLTALGEVDKMKSEFISLASHQLRTPLSLMKWALEVVLDGDAGPLSAKQKHYMENINHANERMIEVVNSLLNIARIESGRIIIEPQPVNLEKLVKEVVEEVQEKIKEKGHILTLHISPHLPMVKLEAKMIRHVYTNLLTNAIKYTPEHGKISITISIQGDSVLSQIKDNGYGIPEPEQKRIFEKFFRASNIIQREVDGTGLGLYLVKAIVTSSQGKIWFESKEGQGTSVYFTLPLGGVTAKKGEVSFSS